MEPAKQLGLSTTMNVLAILSALTLLADLQVSEGILEERVENELSRGFYQPPFYTPSPYHQAYPPPIYPPLTTNPECFPQPGYPILTPAEPEKCPVCTPTICECPPPKVEVCQTYTIKVCPSAPPPDEEETDPVVAQIVEHKVVDPRTGELMPGRKEIIEVPEFSSNPAPANLFGPFPGYHHQAFLGGMFPHHYGGYPPGMVVGHGGLPTSGVRSLADDVEEKDEEAEEDETN